MRYFLILVFLMCCVMGGVGRAAEPAPNVGSDRCQKLKELLVQLNNQINSAIAHGDKGEPYAVRLFETPAAERVISYEDSDELYNESLSMENDLDAATKTIKALDDLIPEGNSGVIQATHMAVGIVLARDGKLIPFLKYRLELPLLNALTCETDEKVLPLCQGQALIPVYVFKGKDQIRKTPFQTFKGGISKDISGMAAALERTICGPANPQ